MEETALLANIATILQKDLLSDQKNNLRSAKHFLYGYNDERETLNGTSRFPLLENDDPDDFHLQFLRKRFKTTAKISKTQVPKASRSASAKPHPVRGQSNEVVIKFDYFAKMTPSDFERNLHMSKSSFLSVFRSLHHVFKKHRKRREEADTAFCFMVWKLTTGNHFEEKIAKKFRQHAVCQALTRICWQIIARNASQFIQWPNSNDLPATMQGFRAHPQLKFLPGLFSVIAVKPVDVFLGSLDKKVTVILQVIINSDQSIIDCFVELSQSYNFDRTPVAQKLREQPNTRYLPQGSYLIGDQNFPLQPFLIRRFENPASEKELSFNRLLAPAHKCAYTVLDKISKRFNILYSLEARDLNDARDILTTICVLHNLCVEVGDGFIEKAFPTSIDLDWARMVTSAAGLQSCRPKNSETDLEGLERRRKLITEIWTMNNKTVGNL